MEIAMAFVQCVALFFSLLSCLSFTKIRTTSLWNVLSGFQIVKSSGSYPPFYLLFSSTETAASYQLLDPGPTLQNMLPFFAPPWIYLDHLQSLHLHPAVRDIKPKIIIEQKGGCSNRLWKYSTIKT